jgi:hypothetical protein
MPKPVRRVLIGTPAHDWSTFVHYTWCYGETIRLLTGSGIDVRGLFPPGEALIQKARNELVRDALEHDFDDLIFIDADQEWKPAWVPQLLSHPVDCVGGAVIKKTDAKELYNVRSPVLPIPVDPATGLLMPEGLGTGFLRLSKRAMHELSNRSEMYQDDTGKVARWIFDVRPVNGRLKSEDILLGDKLRDAGINVYLDPSITCAHVGYKKYTGDFAAWLGKLQAA